MGIKTSFIFLKDGDEASGPIFVLPSNSPPEGFVVGHRVEHRLLDGSWQTLGYAGKNKACTISLRQATGEILHTVEQPLERQELEDHLPFEITFRQGDGRFRVEPLPEGWYRVAGMEVARKELLALLLELKASWKGVMYATTKADEFLVCELASFGNWCQFQMQRQVLALAEDIGYHHLLSSAGPHTLYRVSYPDLLRPGLLPGVSRQHCYCVGYKRPNGPEMMLVVEPRLLREWWPIESLMEALNTDELKAANLIPVPTETV